MWKQWPNLDIKADLCLRRSGIRNLYCNICADIAFNELQILAIEWPSDHQVVYSHASDNLSIVSLCVAVGEFSVSACISIQGNKAVSKCQSLPFNEQQKLLLPIVFHLSIFLYFFLKKI